MATTKHKEKGHFRKHYEKSGKPHHLSRGKSHRPCFRQAKGHTLGETVGTCLVEAECKEPFHS
jgi:hypothetical protein